MLNYGIVFLIIAIFYITLYDKPSKQLDMPNSQTADGSLRVEIGKPVERVYETGESEKGYVHTKFNMPNKSFEWAYTPNAIAMTATGPKYMAPGEPPVGDDFKKRLM